MMKDLTRNGEFPLARFSSIQLSNIDDVYTQFTRLIRKHDVISNDVDKALSELHYSPLSRMALSSARLGINMLVEAQSVDDTCLVMCALDDPFYMTIDGRQVLVTRNKLGIVMPGMEFKLQVPANASSIMLDIELSYLESIIAQEVNDSLKAPLHFSLDNVGSDNEMGFIEPLYLLYDNVRQETPQIHRKAYLTRFEELVASALLYAKPHNYTNALNFVDTQTVPRYVERAVEYMHAHAGDPITLQSLSVIAATSQRSLVRGFQKYKNCSPMSYLREVRLDRAHEDLSRACPENFSVTAIANKWGFYNPGRFARAYRKRFGENPADTLRRKHVPH